MINNVVITGRLTRDPELRKTTAGTSVASFRLACDDSFARPGQEKTTLFIDVTIFGNRADTVAKYMRKGSLVGVVGRLTQRKYLSTKTNTEVTVTEIVANTVEFIGPKGTEQIDDSGFQSDVAPVAPSGFDSTYSDSTSSESSNLSGIDVVDDDLPF